MPLGLMTKRFTTGLRLERDASFLGIIFTHIRKESTSHKKKSENYSAYIIG